MNTAELKFRKKIRELIYEALDEIEFEDDGETADGDMNDYQGYGDADTDGDLGNAFDELATDIKNANFEADENEAVGVLTVAGIALSLPEIVRLLGKFVNLIKKIPGLKRLSGDKLIELGEKYHHKITGTFAYAVERAGVPKEKAKKFANVLHHVVVAMLLVGGGFEAARLATSGSLKGATLKAAINAVKANEIRAFLISMASKAI